MRNPATAVLGWLPALVLAACAVGGGATGEADGGQARDASPAPSAPEWARVAGTDRCPVERAVVPEAVDPLVFVPCLDAPEVEGCVQLLERADHPRVALDRMGPQALSSGIRRPFVYELPSLSRAHRVLGVGDFGRGIVSIVRACRDATLYASPWGRGFGHGDFVVGLDLQGRPVERVEAPDAGRGTVFRVPGAVVSHFRGELRVFREGALAYRVGGLVDLTSVTAVGDALIYADRPHGEARIRLAEPTGERRTLWRRHGVEFHEVGYAEGWLTWWERPSMPVDSAVAWVLAAPLEGDGELDTRRRLTLATADARSVPRIWRNGPTVAATGLVAGQIPTRLTLLALRDLLTGRDLRPACPVGGAPGGGASSAYECHSPLFFGDGAEVFAADPIDGPSPVLLSWPRSAPW